jgi:hypothetical protein
MCTALVVEQIPHEHIKLARQMSAGAGTTFCLQFVFIADGIRRALNLSCHPHDNVIILLRHGMG